MIKQEPMLLNGTRKYDFDGKILLTQKGGWTQAEFGKSSFFECRESK